MALSASPVSSPSQPAKLHPAMLRSAVPTSALRTSAIAIKLIGASPRPAMEGNHPQPGRVNYLIGRDARSWIRNVPTYAGVLEHNVWPAIDLAWHGSPGGLECDFIVSPGARPEAIDLGFTGVESLAPDAAGNLVMRAGGREVRLLKPNVYQIINGARRPIAAEYIVTRERASEPQVRLRLARYDRSRTLIVDPSAAERLFVVARRRRCRSGL